MAQEKHPLDISSEDDGAPQYTEGALAAVFAETYTPFFRYVKKWDKWFRFDGVRWVEDDVHKVWTILRPICYQSAAMLNEGSEQRTLAATRTIVAVEKIARADSRLAATTDQWDADPMLLNTPAGVIDLRTGQMREHRAEDFMTKVTAVAPDFEMATPLWAAYLDKVTKNDKDFQTYLARCLGYALTGSVEEHALFFLFGTGGNGKSTLLSTVSHIFADYATVAPIEMFTDTYGNHHPTEFANLRGSRLVTATEPEEGHRWNEAKIKTMTGGDAIAARFMRQDWFHFIPQYSLMIAGNSRPHLRVVDKAITRRFVLLPFVAEITEGEKDTKYVEKLKTEAPGILAWMVNGCLDWQKIGLASPSTVTTATNSYLKAENIFAQWFEERYVADKDGWVTSAEFYADWCEYADDHGEPMGSAKKLTQRIEDLGYRRDNRMAFGGRGFWGVAQRPEPPTPEDIAAAQVGASRKAREQEIEDEKLKRENAKKKRDQKVHRGREARKSARGKAARARK
jgi:putative DNA primase/helicase